MVRISTQRILMSLPKISLLKPYMTKIAKTIETPIEVSAPKNTCRRCVATATLPLYAIQKMEGYWSLALWPVCDSCEKIADPRLRRESLEEYWIRMAEKNLEQANDNNRIHRTRRK